MNTEIDSSFSVSIYRAFNDTQKLASPFPIPLGLSIFHSVVCNCFRGSDLNTDDLFPDVNLRKNASGGFESFFKDQVLDSIVRDTEIFSQRKCIHCRPTHFIIGWLVTTP
eukprot:Gregarina_sp_Poly_1__4760@NODE_253_length_10628_cov_50_063252_g221_i0_p12_GENE_NODE_253_length_10628_cov_50_063252_g221_i0NODE_253_length_10628_cov_50_063252_g221_i0_p12_ORF_typecomplete_len110_score6_15_NODE_253_length_10628_cov_50_063252_g221_i027363065